MNRKPTRRQFDVLGVVESSGPVTAREVGEYHLPVGVSSARSALSSLERKGFVTAVYTGSGVSMTARSYAITVDGQQALDDEFREE